LSLSLLIPACFVVFTVLFVYLSIHLPNSLSSILLYILHKVDIADMSTENLQACQWRYGDDVKSTQTEERRSIFILSFESLTSNEAN
jgi:hypothetical protein